MPRSTAANGTTASRILEIAEGLAQTRGFNGFSYADIAADVGVTTASLHYHFPTKAALGQALVARYAATFEATLAEIGMHDATAAEKLRQYVRIYREVLGADRMCLCGMFAAEYATLPVSIQAELRSFFDANERWLISLFERGLEDGSVHFEGSPQDVAGLLTGALEGSMLLARSYGDQNRFGAALEQLLTTLVSSKPIAATK
jgi:TetR/AcrR family transcriptional repressor of nem operon